MAAGQDVNPNWTLSSTLHKRFSSPLLPLSGQARSLRPTLPRVGREAAATPEHGLRLSVLGATPTLATALVLVSDAPSETVRVPLLLNSAGKASGLHRPIPWPLTTGAWAPFIWRVEVPLVHSRRRREKPQYWFK